VHVPDTPLTVAVTVLLLVQAPPPAASVSVPVAPAHKLAGPNIVAGDAVTVISFVTVHPEPSE